MAQKATIIVFSGDLDKVVAGFILATSAASMGMEVSMFFTFWGLNVLKKEGGLKKSKGLMRRILNIMNRGDMNRLPLSKFDMFGIGRWLMKKLMKESKIPTVEEMMTMAKSMNIKIIACTTTLGFMGIAKEDLIPEVDALAGAATYLDNAKDSNVNLFI